MYYGFLLSGHSSLTFPGRTSSEGSRKRKRKTSRTDVGGDTELLVRGAISDEADDDRVYFGRRSRSLRRRFRGQSLRDLWQGRRKRRQAFEKSEPLTQVSGESSVRISQRKDTPAGDDDDDDSDCSDDICNNDPDYPLLRIMSGLSRHATLEDKEAFSSLFGATCGNATGLVDVSLRQSFDLKESPLCKAYQKYIFPQKALTVRGVYKYIINTDEYRQGVTVETCSRRAKGIHVLTA